ncbi:MAG: hypothetical protein HQL90_04110 [Magnetococcales bacterium]|nr:hypothetical protein [Magnetococcales bacterium]
MLEAKTTEQIVLEWMKANTSMKKAATISEIEIGCGIGPSRARKAVNELLKRNAIQLRKRTERKFLSQGKFPMEYWV